MFDIFYRKNNNKSLFESLEDLENMNSTSLQNYVPIYKNFFSLNDQNFNNINLNHKYSIESLVKKYNHTSYNVKIKSEKNTINRDAFFKFSPLMDPIKYLSGKYENISKEKLLTLPKLNNKSHKKMLDINNSAYVDSFFSYLTSQVYHEHNFVHGLDFYGSFLCLQNKYIINIADDIEYLMESKFFQEKRNILFTLEDGASELFSETDSRTNKSKLTVNDDVKLDVSTINDELYNNVFKLTEQNLNIHNNTNAKLEYVADVSSNEKANTESSESTCSSRESKTDDSKSSSDSVKSYTGSDTSCDYSNSIDEILECKINEFPVQIICLEKMENTLDSLLGDEFSDEDEDEDESSIDSIVEELTDDEWRSLLFQIIMTLLTYQKMFDFTHNDLHTNNIMYNKTDKKFLYYKYNNIYYKVPTYGKIYKIIDFGRAIYKFKDTIICSDSYHPKGDAATQYNCEPYFNKDKPRLLPNKSFDLCRLGCALYDYFLEDLEDPKVVINPIGKLIKEWCSDDKGKNILYKTNGEERYPDFKLYKMIARTVHKHTPESQLEKGIFFKFQTSKKKIGKKKKFMNIDELPVYFN
tara:strand:- start:342 stop:2087 length:1746 start_codon:yes stop_codon:yes gene_type:complete